MTMNRTKKLVSGDFRTLIKTNVEARMTTRNQSKKPLSASKASDIRWTPSLLFLTLVERYSSMYWIVPFLSSRLAAP